MSEQCEVCNRTVECTWLCRRCDRMACESCFPNMDADCVGDPPAFVAQPGDCRLCIQRQLSYDSLVDSACFHYEAAWSAALYMEPGWSMRYSAEIQRVNFQAAHDYWNLAHRLLEQD